MFQKLQSGLFDSTAFCYKMDFTGLIFWVFASLLGGGVFKLIFKIFPLNCLEVNRGHVVSSHGKHAKARNGVVKILASQE